MQKARKTRSAAPKSNLTADSLRQLSSKTTRTQASSKKTTASSKVTPITRVKSSRRLKIGDAAPSLDFVHSQADELSRSADLLSDQSIRAWAKTTRLIHLLSTQCSHPTARSSFSPRHGTPNQTTAAVTATPVSASCADQQPCRRRRRRRRFRLRRRRHRQICERPGRPRGAGTPAAAAGRRRPFRPGIS
jgi:hypothetical protein